MEVAADGTRAWVACVQPCVCASDGTFLILMVLFDCGWEWSFLDWNRFFFYFCFECGEVRGRARVTANCGWLWSVRFGVMPDIIIKERKGMLEGKNGPWNFLPMMGVEPGTLETWTTGTDESATMTSGVGDCSWALMCLVLRWFDFGNCLWQVLFVEDYCVDTVSCWFWGVSEMCW